MNFLICLFYNVRSEHYNFLPGAKNSEITQNIDDSTMISLDPKIIKIEMTTPVTVSMEIDNGNLVRRDRSFDQLIGVHPFHSALPLLQQKELFDTDFYWLIPIGVRYLKGLWEDESTDIRIIDAILNHALEIESKYNFEKDLESLRIIEAFTGNILFTNHTDENINNSNNNNSKKTDKVNSKVVLPLPDVEGNFNTNNILISKLDEPASKGTFNFISAVFESNSDSGRRGDGDKKGNYFYKSAYDLLMTLDAARRYVRTYTTIQKSFHLKYFCFESLFL